MDRTSFNWGTGYVIYYRKWDAVLYGYIPYIEFKRNIADAKRRCQAIVLKEKVEGLELHYIVDGISERQYKIK